MKILAWRERGDEQADRMAIPNETEDDCSGHSLSDEKIPTVKRSSAST